MRDHFSLTDDIFERQFADCSFDPELFTHEAHLRLAWIHIRKYGIDQAIRNICSQIRQYTVSLGATDKYNETVTIVGIRAVYHFMLKSETETFGDFIAGNPRLKFNFKELLGLHYNTNIFISDKAKATYLKPELLPFD